MKTNIEKVWEHSKESTLMIWKDHPYLVMSWLLIALVTSVFPAIHIWLQKTIIDSITILGGDKRLLISVVLLLALTHILKIGETIGMVFSNYVNSVVNTDLTFRTKRLVGEKCINLSLDYFDNSILYDRIKMAVQSLTYNVANLLQDIIDLIKNIISITSVIIILVYAHWTLPIILITAGFPGIILLIFLKNRRYKETVENTSLARKMEYTFRLLSRKDAAKEIRIFQLGTFLLERWEKIHYKLRKVNLSHTVYEGKVSVSSHIILSLATLVIAVILVWQVDSGVLTVGDYVALSGAALTIQTQFGTIAQSVAGIFEKTLYINNVKSFLSEDIPHSLNVNSSAKINFSKIHIKNISFSYENQEKKVLDNVSFEINRGDSIAIVGENGSGKTTLVNCLLALYKVKTGSILFDDTDINTIDESYLRKQLTAVFQDYMQYQYPLRDNVAMGNISDIDNDNKIMKCLEMAGLDQFVTTMKDGLDSPLGSEFNRGQELSGGQWQRIAIARALMREAEIVILDEPTASLDPQSELDIFNRFHELSKGKTTVTISHCLGPAQLADQILVLSKGRLIEQGTHQQLMDIKGKYYKMFTSQAHWYQNSFAEGDVEYSG
ncbi:ABC transporter ATP-binding protein/permease [Lederbergia sp. NSJ-179]|uniref:ABC transporter ATP-binding protein n=1 Tax=Lederbergia sp. NSJ-179 TaxID=2931402 RepID=UPI001FD0EEB6|nr:ABC transporter ATP-binding protein [Lederbergia sp. NSJ-179]MCJ7841922.1 ABC transporter ATP-binding protein/permease [Lederbergia sp. NSJ-179]